MSTFPGTTGQTLNFGQIESLWISNGGPTAWAPTMAGVALAESSGITNNLNDNQSTGDYSVGLFQINYYGSLLPGRTKEYGAPATLATNVNAQFFAAISILGGGPGITAWPDPVGLAAVDNGGPLTLSQVLSVIAAHKIGGSTAGAVASPSATSSQTTPPTAAQLALNSALSGTGVNVGPSVPSAPLGFTSNIALADFTINGTSLDLIVDNALVTAQLDLSISKASTCTLTIHDPDRTIINSPVFSQASIINFGSTALSFQLTSIEKEQSVLTATFVSYVVAQLMNTYGPVTIAPGTMTRTDFAQLLILQIEGAGVRYAPDSWLRLQQEGYTGQNKEQLSRGTSDLPQEDSWTCLQRLASEIQWVCFESFGTVWFCPYSYLTSLDPVLAPVEFTSGIDTIDGTWDVGQPLSELTVTCYAGSWFPTIGQCVQINDLGPFSQVGQNNWIVSEMERDDLFEPDITITLMQPLPGLPEPSTGGSTAAVGSGNSDAQQTAGGATAAQTALAYAISQLGVPYVYGGENPKGSADPGLDCSALMQLAYESVGIQISRTTYSQWGPPPYAGLTLVAPGINNLLPGDMVYFAPAVGQAPEHVAMVVSVNKVAGTVKIIEAPQPGQYVQYSTMTPTIGAAYGTTLVYIGALRAAG